MTTKYAALVARREYVESIKTKGFWIGIFMMPLVFFLSIKVPVMLEKKGTPTRYFVLVDQTGDLGAVVESRLEKAHQKEVLGALKEYARKNVAAAPPADSQQAATELARFAEWNSQAVDDFVKSGGKDHFVEKLQPALKAGAPPFKEPRRLFQRVKLPPEIDEGADLPAIVRELRPYLRGEKQVDAGGWSVELSTALLIPREIQIVRPNAKPGSKAEEAKGIEYWAGNLADTRLRDEIEAAVNTEVRRREFVARGMDAAAIKQVEQTYVPLASLNPKKESGKETVDKADVVRQWAPSGFVYLLWVAIFAIVQMLLNNIIEEKSNRIIEVLLSSVTPGELMMGKLMGIAAIGLTMVGAWVLSLFVILSWQSGGAAEVAGPVLTVLKTSKLVPMFSLYFLLGYVLYAGLILALGSVCNTLKEAQSYMGMITMLMMVPLLTMTYIPKDPNGSIARLLSWIPIYTPFAMLNRVNADPPLFDLVGTMVLLLASTALVLWMAGKIFRIGILRMGQPPKILEMLRWLRRG